MLEPILITAEVTSVLEKLHVRYFIGGSLASTLHGMLRTTLDSDRESFFKVDVFIPEIRPFVEEQLARAQRQVLSIEPRVEAFVATPEDTLLAKLEWYRIGGEVSERQWRDVLGILKVQGDRLDIGYLRQWAEHLKVSDMLKRALIEASV